MAVCTHLDDASTVDPSPADGCAECVESGDRWVHLRMCASCGHVGCCDSSPNRHASRHAGDTEHPLIRSYEPGEAWWFCFVDDVAFEVPGHGPLIDRYFDPR
jgi:CPA2 family monovalent cation:H+ antiporter-2